MKFDLIIIGSGSAGYVAAIRAAQAKKSVLVIEASELGGTCLNRGCIPTKHFLSYADNINFLKKPRKGIKLESFNINLDDIFLEKKLLIDKLKSGIESLFKFWKIQVIKGFAVFETPDSIKVNNEIYYFENLIIATGSKSIIPDEFNVLDFTIDSNYILENTDIGKSIVILGAGVIGVEFAFVLNSLGIQVTIVEKLKSILINEEADAVRYIENSMKKKGILIYKNTSVKKLEKGLVYLDNDQILEANKFLVAVGRKPNTENLFCDKANIELTQNKSIKIDENFCTSNPKVFAIGDVTGGIQLAHYASAMADELIKYILNKSLKKNKLKVVPRVIYSCPRLAAVGITEQQAKSLQLNYKVAKSFYASNSKALISDASDGFVKVLSDSNGIILGATVVGSEADLMITPFTIAMTNNMSVSDLANVIFPHPSLSEAVHDVSEELSGVSLHKARRT